MMTSRAVFFVVAKRNGVEHPMLHWDELPSQPIPNRVYTLRLDTLPDGEILMTKSVSELFRIYQRMARRGALPPGYEPPKQK